MCYNLPMVGTTAAVARRVEPGVGCTSLSRRHDLLILCARIGFNP